MVFSVIKQLDGIIFSSMDLGDHDGDLDLVFAGTDNNFDDKVYLYVNNGTALPSFTIGVTLDV